MLINHKIAHDYLSFVTRCLIKADLTALRISLKLLINLLEKEREDLISALARFHRFKSYFEFIGCTPKRQTEYGGVGASIIIERWVKRPYKISGDISHPSN